MAILQGNTYLLPVQVKDCDGAVIHVDQVVKGEFTFGSLVKFYGESGDVSWDEALQSFIVPLTEEETFAFKGVVAYQGRLLLKNGSVSGSVPTSEYIYESIGKTILSGSNEVGEQSGKVLSVKLLDRVVNTGITEETDPTVPSYVKEITEQDISEWNKIKSLGGVLRLKGSVQTYADLPTENNQVGDVYNVIEAYGDYGAGTNFAWTTEGTWDALGGKGGTIDLSGYVTADEFNKLVNNETQIASNSPTRGLRIGNASNTSTYGISIGAMSSSFDYSIAIGTPAAAQGSKRIQLGNGTNTKNNTLQVFNDNIYNHSTHTLTVQNIELNGENLAEKLESAGGTNVVKVEDGTIETTKLEKVVHLSEEQYQELITNGSITIGEQTLTYSDNVVYVTPDNSESESGGAESGGSAKKYRHMVRLSSNQNFIGVEIINSTPTAFNSFKDVCVALTSIYGEVYFPIAYGSYENKPIFRAFSQASGRLTIYYQEISLTDGVVSLSTGSQPLGSMNVYDVVSEF